MAKLFGNIIFKIFSDLTQSRNNHAFRRHLALFRRSQKEKGDSSYIILKASKDDFVPILKLMHEAYYPEEPTCYYLGIKQNSVLDESAMKDMAEGLSLVARCKYDGCIVGACINSTSSSWDPEMIEKLACGVKCPKVQQLLLFNAYVQRFPQLWNCFEVQKVFEMSYVFVKRQHRRKGIGYRLLRDSKELAADCGFKVVRCDATTKLSAGICNKLNMELYREIPYCSYLGKNLVPLFDLPTGDTALKIYVDVDPQIAKTSKKK